MIIIHPNGVFLPNVLSPLFSSILLHRDSKYKVVINEIVHHWLLIIQLYLSREIRLLSIIMWSMLDVIV